MSRKTRIDDLTVAIASKFNQRLSERGLLANLPTTDKSSIVAAIIEISQGLASAAVIDDAATGNASAWSAAKIASEIQLKADQLTGLAPGILDTFEEVATAIQNNDLDIAGILTAQANRVRVDSAQSFDAAQQQQGRANIDAASSTDVGDTDADFVAVFNTALNT